jgi:hypothetical protein
MSTSNIINRAHVNRYIFIVMLKDGFLHIQLSAQTPPYYGHPRCSQWCPACCWWGALHMYEKRGLTRDGKVVTNYGSLKVASLASLWQHIHNNIIGKLDTTRKFTLEMQLHYQMIPMMHVPTWDPTLCIVLG